MLRLRKGMLALLGLSSAALWGCAVGPERTTAPPPTPSPPASLAAAWQAPAAKVLQPHSAASGAPVAASTDTTRTGAASSRSDWWQSLGDPLLPELVSAAQMASADAAQALARLQRARASAAVAAAAQSPQLGAQAGASHGRAALGQPVATQASAGLQAQWELDLFGAVAAGRDAALARQSAAAAGWHAVQVAIAAETASLYTALRGCEALLAQARLDSQSRDATARLTELSARAGFTAPADAALTRAGAAQARTGVLAQQAACEAQLKSLVELTDLPEPQLRQRLAARTAVLPSPRALSVPAVPAALLAQRPDLADTARLVNAAAADQAQAQARERPQVSLAGSIAGLVARGGGAEVRGLTWNLGPISVSFPIFDGGARAAATASARASYDEAVALYQSQVRRAVREVEAALVSLQSTTDRQTDLNAAAQDFEVFLRATEARTRGGLGSLFELEIARRNAVQAQSALIDLQRERAVAWISLYRALGGAWSADDPSPGPGKSL